jgi:hypothetical protein
MIQNFCESLIFLESFPRCQINICINILTFENEKLVRTNFLSISYLQVSLMD